MDIIERKHYLEAKPLYDNGVKVHWGFKLLPEGFEAITLFGHVFDVREKGDLKLFLNSIPGITMVNHERIHILQAKSFKLGYLTFYVLYLWYWIIGLFKYGTKNNISYYNIPFEREAYTKEKFLEYNESHWKEYR